MNPSQDKACKFTNTRILQRYYTLLEIQEVCNFTKIEIFLNNIILI